MLVAHLSDTHLLADPTEDLWDHNTTRNLAATVEALPKDLDVMVLTGDIAEAGAPDAYRRALAMTRGVAPRRYFLAGNHDDPRAMQAVLGPPDGLRTARISDTWTIALLDTHWSGHEEGRVGADTLGRLHRELASIESHVALWLHHPPVSPCSNTACGLSDADDLLEVVRNTRVRVVMSGHVHQQFDTTMDGIRFLGGPSTFRQLRHGGDPHYQDTHEPPAGQLVELADDGAVDCQIVRARSITPGGT